jgi:hypothetical protein
MGMGDVGKGNAGFCIGVNDEGDGAAR